jgi:DNA polymerase III epsilon subunit-like protein
MINILKTNYLNNNIYFVAYNNFGFDQIILENNFKICNIEIPNNWYFIDIYPIIKELYKIKPNYKLKSVYEYLFGKDENVNYHCALADTQCLHKIFKKINTVTNSQFFHKYSRSLLHSTNIFKSPVSSLNGYSNGMLLNAKSIYTIGDLYDIYRNCNYDINIFEDYLRTKLNIYSDYYRSTIIKQISIIHYFHK